MLITPEYEDRMIRYLLGELPPEELVQVERNYFEDDDVFEFIQALEGELVRDFVGGDMAPALRRRFEARYREIPSLNRKIQFAEAAWSAARVHSYQDSTIAASMPDQKGEGASWRFLRFRLPVFQLAACGVAVSAIVVNIFLWQKGSDLSSELARVQRENQSLAMEKSALKRALSEKSKEPLLLASFILGPGQVRSEGGAAPLSVPRGLGLVNFKVPLPSGIRYSGYRASLEKENVGEVLRLDLPPDALVDSGGALILGIPSPSVTAGQYLLYVKGKNKRGEYEDVQYYVFTVSNQSK